MSPPAASTDDTTRSPFARCPTVLMNSKIMDTYLLEIEALISKVWLTRTQCRAIRGKWLDIIEGDDMSASCGPRYVACLARQQYDGAHIVALRVPSCRVPQTKEEDMTRTRTIRTISRLRELARGAQSSDDGTQQEFTRARKEYSQT